jgi:hypothetical protein
VREGRRRQKGRKGNERDSETETEFEEPEGK